MIVELRVKSLGRVKKGEPKRRYTYALVDPVDKPYVTFRYRFERRSGAPMNRSLLDLQLEDDTPDWQKSPLVEHDNHIPLRRLLTPSKARLLPIPPSLKANSPIKKADAGGDPTYPSEANAGHDGFGEGSDVERRDCAVETSPLVQADMKCFERAHIPPSITRRRDGPAGLLQGVIANALVRRRGDRELSGKKFIEQRGLVATVRNPTSTD